MGSDLDRPLGQDRKAPRSRPPRLGGRSAIGLLAIVGIVALASLAAFQSDDLRQTAAVTEPDVPADPLPAAYEPADAHQDVTTGVTPRPSGRSGADVTTEMTGDGESVTIFRPGARQDDGPQILDGGTVGQDLRFAHLPEPVLLEETAQGALPRRSDTDRPIDAYARSWSGARGTRIAIVVGGLGLSQTGTQYAIETLPEEVTLGFAAGGNSLQRWMQAARRGGHEIVLQVPFEPFNDLAGAAAGETLTIAAGEEANLASLHAAMAQLTNYTGIMNHLGGKFLADAGAIEPIMRDLADRGLLFLDDGTSAQSKAELVAGAVGTPFAAAELVIDINRDRGSMLERLDALERVAVRNGQAIGVASAFDESVDTIAAWIEDARSRNIEIVGVAALADDPERQR
ncbi:divergent polysaccharide deacetylase family protein [Pararhizobium haloflavum]|uniref:divergent polysaccharide deacetylase family protein n=1 Tax=Pararhizobium haloflavum TaxID=2037914 RepID=UPI000C18302F|nr:divergent polysaccharide deacetylase family protein [Pararhizobium haloflavum]